MLLEGVTARLKGRAPIESRAKIWARRITVALAAFGIGCIAYGYFVEPYWPEVTHVRLESGKIPRGSRPIRIVHLSDFHSDPKPRLEQRIPDLVATQRPDVIVFTGDAVNGPEGLPNFKGCLIRLAHIAPTFVVRGNFDVLTYAKLDFFGDTGARELNGTAERLVINGTELWIAGVGLSYENRISDALGAIPPGSLAVFLYHTPDQIEAVAGRGVDLYLAGHTHGGQIRVPFYGALVVLSEYGKRFEAGLHRVGQTWLYVNRGIGMEGFSAPRVRFLSRPEITVIELVPAS